MTKFLRCVPLFAAVAITMGVMTACGGGASTAAPNSNTSTPPTANVVLKSIQVSAANASVAAGSTQQFTATGTYSDGSTKDLTTTATWTSSNSSVLTIAGGGTAKAMSAGNVVISATQANLSGTLSLVVASAALNSITISSTASSLTAGLTIQLTATGNYSDGSTKDLTATAAWSSSNSNVATIASGSARGISAGTAVIIATAANVSGTTSLVVAPPALNSITVSSSVSSVTAGYAIQFTATGNYSDGSNRNLSATVTWGISNLSVATISTGGLVTGKSNGSEVVTASLGSVSGTANLTVGPPVLASLSVSSANASVGVGFTDQFTATGTYSDGSTQNLTNSATWSVSNPALATISSSGLLTAKSNGAAVISAASGSINGSAPLAITISLTSLAISPLAPTIAPSTDQQFKATGTFSDGSTQDLTGAVTWNSSNPTTAAISNSAGTTGLAQGLQTGTTTITASSGGIVASPATLSVSSVKLNSIVVTPTASTVALGIVQQFTAMGTFSDGTTQNITSTVAWTSSQPNFASITVSGAATARNLGTTTITATSGSVTANTSLTVNAANLASLSMQPTSITIAENTTSKLSAIGLFSDGSTRDVSAQATWTSSNPAFATIQTNGKLQGISPGLASVTATLGSQSISANVNVTNASVVSISVTPSISSIAPGTPLTFAATGQFSDGSTQVISSNVNWSSSDNTIATVSNVSGTKGIAGGIGSGTATVSAIFEAITGTAQLNVSGAHLTGIVINPPSATLAPASTEQCTATATYDDGTSQNVSTVVTWSSSDSSVATVTGYGQATGQSSGLATITASLGAFSGTANVLVESSALKSITVTPQFASDPQQIVDSFTAIGYFVDGSSQDLTAAVIWTSSNSSVATISDAAGTRGQAMGVAPGTTSISAVFAGIVGPAPLTVTNLTLTGLTISPNPASINLGTAQPFIATGAFSDGTTTLNLSTQVTWTSSNPNVAVISPQGLATSASTGTTTITATLNGVSTTAVLTVN